MSSSDEEEAGGAHFLPPPGALARTLAPAEQSVRPGGLGMPGGGAFARVKGSCVALLDAKDPVARDAALLGITVAFREDLDAESAAQLAQFAIFPIIMLLRQLGR